MIGLHINYIDLKMMLEIVYYLLFFDFQSKNRSHLNEISINKSQLE